MAQSNQGLLDTHPSPGTSGTSPSPGAGPEPSGAHVAEAKELKKEEAVGTSGRSKARHVKGKISFQASSMERRNVDKHLVRYILLNHSQFKTEVLEEYKRQHLDEAKYEHSDKLLASLRSEEKNKNGQQMKRDYANIVSIMLSNEYLRAILKVCLQHSLNDLRDKRTKRVKDKNREIYISAIQDYLTALNPS